MSSVDSPTSIVPDIIQLIEKLAKRITRIQRDHVSKENLTPPQYKILQSLEEKDGQPFKALAINCECAPSTITGIIDGLEKKGLVKRTANPEDRRSLLVVLTKNGETVIDESPSVDKIFGKCCPALTLGELQTLHTLLEKFAKSLEVAPSPSC